MDSHNQSNSNNNTEIIIVDKLQKHFTSSVRREGLVGSFKDLFFRQSKSVEAVKELSFKINKGELIGYIGPNGAGKSTSIKMLTGILKPSSGTIKIMGYEPFKDRRKYTKYIGVVFGQRSQLWWDLAVIESLRLLGKIYGLSEAAYLKRLEELTQILDLKALLSTPVRKLSLGQRMRCDLAASLIHSPEVLFLDEPTIGLDAVTKDAVREFLKKINKEFGTTIILTTHDLKEIEELCERILILDHGRLIYDGSLSRIKTISGLQKEVTVLFNREILVEEVKVLFDDKVSLVQLPDKKILIQFNPESLPTVEVVKIIMSAYEVADLTISDPNIEEVVLKIYREGLDSSVSL